MLAGWFTTEVGRQPWVVYGIMHQGCTVTGIRRTGGANPDNFVVVYCVVFGIGIYYMLRLMHRSEFIHSRPHHETDSDVVQASRRPLSSIRERIEEVPEQPDQEDKND